MVRLNKKALYANAMEKAMAHIPRHYQDVEEALDRCSVEEVIQFIDLLQTEDAVDFAHVWRRGMMDGVESDHRLCFLMYNLLWLGWAVSVLTGTGEALRKMNEGETSHEDRMEGAD